MVEVEAAPAGAAPGGGESSRQTVLSRETERTIADTQKWFLLAVAVMNLVFPAALFWSGLPEPWDAFDGEKSLINWFTLGQATPRFTG